LTISNHCYPSCINSVVMASKPDDQRSSMDSDAGVLEQPLCRKRGPSMDSLISGASSLEGHAIMPLGDPVTGVGSCELTMNLILSITGTTVLGIGAQMKRGGWILTPLLICGGGAIASEMTRLVSVTIDKLVENGDSNIQFRAYQDFAEGALGKRARKLTCITSTCDLICAICVGLSLESSNFQFLMPIALPWFGRSDSGKVWWAVILSLMSLVYYCVDLNPLVRFSAYVGPVACVINVSFAVLGSAVSILDLEHFPESCLGGDAEPYWWFGPGPLDLAFMNIAAVASYGLYCFAVVVTVPSLKNEMTEPRQLVKASSRSFCVCVFVFLCISMLGYAGLGNLGADNLIENMRCHRPPGWWAMTRPWETGSGTRVGQMFSFLATFNMLLIDATYVPCAVIAVEATAPGFFTKHVFGRATARTIVLLLRFVVATESSSFVALTSFSSSLFCVCNNVLLPIGGFYYTRAQEVGPLRKLVHVLLFCFGCFVMVFGTVGAVATLVMAGPSSEQAPGIFPRPGITQACREEFAHAVNLTAQ